MDKNRPVRFGLIGFGAWGQHHAQAIATCPDADLVAIAAPSDASRRTAGQTFPAAEVFADYREMLERSDIDCVDIVVPSHLHFPVASDALRAGRHVLLEKPMCVRLEECDALIELAQQRSVHLIVGHELRLSSMWGLVKDKVDAGFIGQPLYALVELSRNPYRMGSDGWRYDIARVGNWILEEPIHFFDLARWYMAACGEPCEVYATARAKRPEHPELQDNFSAILKLPNGSYAVVTQTLCAFEHHQTVKLTGTEGALWASWSGAMDRTRHPTFSLRAFDGQQVETLPIEKMTGELFELEDQIQVLCDVVRGRRQPHCTAEDGRWAVAMCLAAQRSVDTGFPVSI